MSFASALDLNINANDRDVIFALAESDRTKQNYPTQRFKSMDISPLMDALELELIERVGVPQEPAPQLLDFHGLGERLAVMTASLASRMIGSTSLTNGPE